jgi:hypothetical protein
MKLFHYYKLLILFYILGSTFLYWYFREMHKVALMSDEYDVRNINDDENRSEK